MVQSKYYRAEYTYHSTKFGEWKGGVSVKLRFAEKLAIVLTALMVAFCGGYYLRGTTLDDAVVIETEKTAPVTAAAAPEASAAPASEIPLPSRTPAPEPSVSAPAADAAPMEGAASTAEEMPEAPQDGRLDLNTATLEELETLPGIGPVLGQRILDYRAEYGGFQTVDELIYVKGIGEKTLEKIENLVKVGE